MSDFTNIPGISVSQQQKLKDRIGRRDVLPASIKGRFLPQDLLSNTSVERVSASVPTGSKITLTSTITASDNKSRRVGHLPYMIQVYIGTATDVNILPSGSSIDTTDYDIYSWDVPQVTGGTDGNNIVRKTTVANNSGDTKTIIFDIQSRVMIVGSPETS